MAAATEMGEIDDIHCNEESTDNILVNGNITDDQVKGQHEIKKKEALNHKTEEEMEIAESAEMIITDEFTSNNDMMDSDDSQVDTKNFEEQFNSNLQPKHRTVSEDEIQIIDGDVNESVDSVKSPKNASIQPNKTTISVKKVHIIENEEMDGPISDDLETQISSSSICKKAIISEDEVHVIEGNEDDPAIDSQESEKSNQSFPTEEFHQSHNSSDDVVIVDDDMKQADDIDDDVREIEDDDDVETIDNIKLVQDSVRRIKEKKDLKVSTKENGTTTPEKDKDSDDCTVVTPRRSSRQQAQLAKRNYESFKSNKVNDVSDESDIEEVIEEDPLAESQPKKCIKSSTIVVNDTKRLVEIASKTSTPNTSKKEPTLVIIDTNSILSGRGAVPASQQKPATTSTHVLPMALPAQGLYPTNMRATITPIPMSTTTKPVPALTPMTATTSQAAILPSLTDDMFVVEAPSFIVPYVYEKPPLQDFKACISKLGRELKKGDDAGSIKSNNVVDNKDDNENRKSYFESPIGNFLADIGLNLVQEYVQTDLLKQQKRKRDREGGVNPETNKTIQSLVKSLEHTKENNEPYKTTLKKCEFCNFKTDSMHAMNFHLETPHMKNFVYRCNFCTYEVRSPHDILFHMEADHCVRGRLERAPAFHQCPNCPFEDNQKGKLSRHAVACARKFKPEKNLEPPLDWDPPAKIGRQPRMKTPNLAMTAAMYQAMAKSTQAQLVKNQAVALSPTGINRGRGRPPGIGMSSKTSKPKKMQDLIPTVLGSGSGSVLVPTNFQISGNQLYQVIGNQDMGSRLGGPIDLFPKMSSTSNSITIQNSSPKTKAVHQPSISITPLPRGSTSSAINMQGGGAKPGDSNSNNSFVICEICDGYIRDLEQLRNHMQWIHKVKIHPKMIYNRPPLNCQKCQFRFFTDQGLERHLLGSHGLVTSSMQEAANKSKDSGRCPVCGKVYQWKLLNHVARDHNMTLKPAHLSYKCTVCTATFGMYKQFENHVYSAHSVVAKRSMDKKSPNTSTITSKQNESLLKPLKINDEITIIPQMPKSNGAGPSKDHTTSSSGSNSNAANMPSTSRIGGTSITRREQLTRHKTILLGGSI